MTDSESQRLFAILPAWFRRIVEVARETALSEGDLVRLTDDMVDREQGVIEPEGGRIKTGVRQVAPLTNRVAEILDEIEAERKQSKVRNVHGLVFTRTDGKRITKDAITGTLKRACRDAKVKNFRFHDLRHCAKTAWARKGIPAESAMLAAGIVLFKCINDTSTYSETTLQRRSEFCNMVATLILQPSKPARNQLKSLPEGWVSG